MALSAESKPVITVQVRELVEFVLRRGGLGGEREFVGRDRSLAGIRGHQWVQRSRAAGYRKEVALSHDIETEDLVLRVQGRIDGLMVQPQEALIEEIKTVQRAWDGVADPLHWAQAKCYAWIYAHQEGLREVAVRLTYLELRSGKQTELLERFVFEELSGFFEALTAEYLEWLREQRRWQAARDASIQLLAFPFSRYRQGQREMAVAVYRSIKEGGRLFLEAPTGVGKTMSVLFPAVKAMGEGKLERIFYLTARTVGRTVAERALAELRAAGLRLRSLTLTAKEKVCVLQGQPCDTQICPLASRYYDRRKAAMREVLACMDINRSVLEAAGQRHQVCPFELSLDVSSWVDAVICDYNYAFDPKVYLRRHFSDKPADYAFLVDEAHNLVDRAREMFSAGLDSSEVSEVSRTTRNAVPRCARALSRLNSALKRLGNGLAPEVPSHEPAEPAAELDLFSPQAVPKLTELDTRRGAQSAPAAGNQEAHATRELPAGIVRLAEQALNEAEGWLAQNQAAEFRERLLGLYFRLNTFCRAGELYDERFATIIEHRASIKVRLFCLDPSFLLGQALRRGKAAVFFSATLAPIDYYRDLLGGSPEDRLLRLPSPFPPENLAVLVAGGIQTRLKARDRTLDQVVQAIGALVQERPGNYLVYLPSYQYLVSVRDRFRRLFPGIRILSQEPGMPEAGREQFLAAFAAPREGTLAGFAVLGGIFGEGIDLAGERLIGAVVVGVGLSQLCLERDLIRAYFEECSGTGFDYAYTFPGMNRVLQATGRVIRSETDRGVILLIDSRFNHARYRRLFPAWWRPRPIGRPGGLRQALGGFWGTATSTSNPGNQA